MINLKSMVFKKSYRLSMFLFICLWDDVVSAKLRMFSPAGIKNITALAVPSCGEMDCSFNETINCSEKCGCDKTIPFRFNVTTGECVLNLKTLMLSLAEKYKTQEKNRKRTEIIFQGVMVSGIIVITWASMCLFLGCFYCCRIRYTDNQLRKNVKEVAKKFKEHHTANKKRANDEKLEELQPCRAVREEMSVV